MKFSKIILDNIASFKNKTIIDFNSIPSDEIFAITGPTGSGKSTIINSIGLALFGRSIKGGAHSKDYVTTGKSSGSIELDFEYAGHSYKAIWNCKTRKKDGTSLKAVQIKRLFYKDGEIFENDIESIIPLSFEQFTKTIILPQGEFADFLTSSFSYRKEILEQIVANLNFAEMSSYLKQKYKQEKLNLSNLQDQLDIGLPYSYEEIQKMIEENSVTQSETNAIEKSLVNFEQYFERIRNLLTLIDTIKRFKTKIAQYNETYKMVFKNIDQLTQQRNRAKEYFNKAQEEESQKRPMLLQAIQLESEISAYVDQISKHENNKEQLKLQIQNVQEIHHEIELEKNDCKTKLDRLIKWRKSFGLTDLEINKVQELFNQSSKLVNEFELVQQQLKEETNRDFVLKNDLESLKEKKEDLQFQLKQLNLSNNVDPIEAHKNSSTLEVHLKEIIERDQEIKLGEDNLIKLRKVNETNKSSLQNLERTQKEAQVALDLVNEKIKTQNLEASIILCREHGHSKGVCPVCEQIYIPPLKESTSQHKIEGLINEKSALKEKIKDIEENRSFLLRKIDMNSHELDSFISEIDKKHKINQSLFSLYEVESITQLELFFEKLKSDLKKSEQISHQYDKLNLQLKVVIERLKEYELKKEQSSQAISVREKNLKLIENDFNLLYQEFDKESLLPLPIKQQKLSQFKQMIELSNQALYEMKLHQKRLSDSISSLIAQKDKLKQIDDDILKIKNDLTVAREKLAHIHIDENLSASENLIQLATRTQKAQDALQNIERDYQRDHLALKESETSIKMAKDNIAQNEEVLSQEVLKINDLSNIIRDEKIPLIDEELILAGDPNVLEILQILKEEVNQQVISFKELININTRKINENGALIKLYQKKKSLLESIQRQVDDLGSKFKMTSLLVDIIGRDEFRSYALGIIEDSIIAEANHELQFLANGRYLLESESSRGKNEFYIYDRWFANKKRKVSTLSGGETFIVSLSLALGLSSVLKGTTEINSFFIDEGFGTLDEESLDEVAETLFRLGKSGKQIGIISHIKKLTDQIPVQINLTKNSSKGSFSQIILS